MLSYPTRVSIPVADACMSWSDWLAVPLASTGAGSRSSRRWSVRSAASIRAARTERDIATRLRLPAVAVPTVAVSSASSAGVRTRGRPAEGPLAMTTTRSWHGWPAATRPQRCSGLREPCTAMTRWSAQAGVDGAALIPAAAAEPALRAWLSSTDRRCWHLLAISKATPGYLWFREGDEQW